MFNWLQRRRFALHGGVLALIALLPVCYVYAQRVTATMVGTVTDPQGGVIPGVSVEAKDIDTGISQHTATNGTGEYRIDFLPVGHYSVTFTHQGFKNYVQQNVLLTVDQVQTVNAPGYRDVDMAAFRNFHFEQRCNLQARLEATNMSNKVSLNAPNGSLTSKLFGTIASAAGARELQLGMRVTF